MGVSLRPQDVKQESCYETAMRYTKLDSDTSGELMERYHVAPAVWCVQGVYHDKCREKEGKRDFKQSYMSYGY